MWLWSCKHVNLHFCYVLLQVKWKKSDVKFEDRFDKYLDPSFFQHRVSWILYVCLSEISGSSCKPWVQVACCNCTGVRYLSEVVSWALCHARHSVVDQLGNFSLTCELFLPLRQESNWSLSKRKIGWFNSLNFEILHLLHSVAEKVCFLPWLVQWGWAHREQGFYTWLFVWPPE